MSGTTITNSELIDLIKVCAENGVSHIEHGKIKLKFYKHKHHNQNLDMAVSQDVMGSDEVNHEDLSHSFNDEKPVDDTTEIDEQYLTQLSIEDPVTYEELSIKRLVEEGNEI